MIIKLDLKRVFDNFYSEINHTHTEQNITYSNVLNTTAQTLSGAINEHESDINKLQNTFDKIMSTTIDDGSIDTIDQDYVFIDKINTNFIVSCVINVDLMSQNGLIGLGVINSLPNNNFIDNIPGITVQIQCNSFELFSFLNSFNDDSHVGLEYDNEYKFILERKDHVYTGKIYDLTTGNLCISKTITNNINFEYIIIYGVGELTFTYTDVQLNADRLLKTESQTLVGAINELYDDREYIFMNLVDKVNEL